MKKLLLLSPCILNLAGCASYQGGEVDRADTVSGADSGTMSAPTFRPGMHRQDVRDPNALGYPGPVGPSSSTTPVP